MTTKQLKERELQKAIMTLFVEGWLDSEANVVFMVKKIQTALGLSYCEARAFFRRNLPLSV